MMIRSYLAWSQSATAADRMEAVLVLADLYLNGELSTEDRRDAEAALLLALDDPAPMVRRALARQFGGSDKAPFALVSALSQDLPDIALIVLANSPVIKDPALVDALALGDLQTQMAIASRTGVSAGVAAAIAEVGEPDALCCLIRNETSDIPMFSLERIVERHADDGAVRQALLEVGDLPAEIR
ncbi:MAG: DUF2336 domain-containing protein, partial [Bosea sp. (in: a-proteobacteria)]